ncbi:hypothetical protein Nitsa_1835 [Nitratifractor salsuginis DSM 16511]|uniref:Uncharacterized protein n=1 Tax=Nitratifractor salsuginis (strain DSM 16511 / JCM 12458 / E9I37-1) TaxID=749222 RepID=E6X211_NITSE|nr:hypothetical protein Nitsa_1835 [Nitratifractor salsuginis DSM 16511]
MTVGIQNTSARKILSQASAICRKAQKKSVSNQNEKGKK